MGEMTDLFFTLLAKLGRWFNVRGKKFCFVLGMVCVLYWAIRNGSMGLMVQTLGCFVSFGFHMYGYYNWSKKGID